MKPCHLLIRMTHNRQYDYLITPGTMTDLKLNLTKFGAK